MVKASQLELDLKVWRPLMFEIRSIMVYYPLISHNITITFVPRATSYEDNFMLWSMAAILEINL